MTVSDPLDTAVVAKDAPIAGLRDRTRDCLATATNLLAEAILLISIDGRVQSANPAAEQLFGLPLEALVGSNISSFGFGFIPESPRARAHAIASSLVGGVPHEADEWIRRPDGSSRAVHIRVAPLKSAARLTGVVLIFQDTTELVRLGAELEAARASSFADPATGLPGRQLGEVMLSTRQVDLDRSGLPYGFVLIDVRDPDGTTSALLQRCVADGLRRAVRRGDTLVRWSDTSFGVIASQVDDAGLKTCAKRLWSAAARCSQTGSAGGRVTIHAGAALGVQRARAGDVVARAELGLATATRAQPVQLISPAVAAGRVLGG